MCDKYVNNYLQEVELCIQLPREFNSEFLENLKILECNFKGEIDIYKDINSLRLSIKKIVDVENNIVLQKIVNFIKTNEIFLLVENNDEREITLSIYVWSTEASDTPQIDFNNETLTILSGVGADLSLIIYTYEPD